MEYKDYYEILGVDKSAGKEEIKKKYIRKLARQYHPDVNTSDKDAGLKFGEISEAYDVLSDDEKRRIRRLRLGLGAAPGSGARG